MASADQKVADRRQRNRAECRKGGQGKDGSGHRERHWVQYYAEHVVVGSSREGMGTAEIVGEGQDEDKSASASDDGNGI